MKTNTLKVLKNEPKGNSISDIIGRDARPVLELNPPEFIEAKIDFANPGIKWLTGLFKYEKEFR